jgi:hypothetical protein
MLGTTADAAVAADAAATFRKNVLRSTGFTGTSGEESSGDSSLPLQRPGSSATRRGETTIG